MAIPIIYPDEINWLSPWIPITDEEQSLEFGKMMNPEVASSVLGELRREICETHPLYDVECVPLAYDAQIQKDFLFGTSRSDMPIALVHFTWSVEPDPAWPFVIGYPTIQAFLKSERNQKRYRVFRKRR